MKERVFDKHVFAEEAIGVFKMAEKMAQHLKEGQVACSHVFAVCVINYPEVIHTLLGREIGKLPAKFEADFKNNGKKKEGNEIDFAQDLVSLFLDTAPGTALQIINDCHPNQPLGVAEIAFALLMEPSDEICDILIANGFPNNAALFESTLKENYLRNIDLLYSVSLRDRMTAASELGVKFEKYMSGHIHGQRKIIRELSSLLTNFWYNGNNALPYVVLLLSKTGAGRSFFADTMQRAFVELGLQSKVEPPLDMSVFQNDSSCETDLLGDAKSYKNAQCGTLYRITRSNRRGIIVFEDILEGVRNAKSILRSFASNLAFDKYYEELMLLPFNVLVLTMKVTDEQYRFIMDKRKRNIDAKLMDEIFLEQHEKERGSVTPKFPMDASALWHRADKILLLEQLSEEEQRPMLAEKIAKVRSKLRNGFGITLKFNSMERFKHMILLSAPKEFCPRELMDAFSNVLDTEKIQQEIYHNSDINEIVVTCPKLPKYPHDMNRRIIRGDFLTFNQKEKVSGKTLHICFEDLRYEQEERIDCADYRIERPKGIGFDDIIGLDDVRDELLDALAFITNRDVFGGKAPAPCLNFILHGPPGTGKTSIAIALANTADIPVFFASSSLFSNPWKIKDMFRKAKEMAPAIVVLEEFNSIGNSNIVGKRDAINELLSIMDGVEKNGSLMVIASTNHIEQIEEGLLRGGRFGRHIKIDYPSANARTEYVHYFERKYNFKLSADVLNEFVTKTEQVSIADIKGVLGYALRGSVRTNSPVDSECLNSALQKFRKLNAKNSVIGFLGGNER